METMESIIFQYMGDYKNAHFKDVLKILKEYPVNPNEWIIKLNIIK